MGRTLQALFLTGCLAALALAADMKPAPVTTDANNATEASTTKRSESQNLPSMEENLIIGKDEEKEAIFSEIGRDLPPEVALKTATRMLEEEAERRKKFRSMMRSLVYSDLPLFDPSIAPFDEEMEKTPSREEEAGVVSKQEEDVSESPPSIAQILPFMFPQPFLPPPFRSLFAKPDSGKEGFPESEKSRMVFIERIPFPMEKKSVNKKAETSLNNPMMLFIPRRTLRIDMTFIPIHRETSKKFTPNEEDVKALEVSPESSNPHSIRVFSSGAPPNHDSVSFAPRGPLAFARFLNFFRFNDDDEVAESAKLKKPIAGAQKGTRRKREATSTSSNPSAEDFAAAVETSRAADATRVTDADSAPLAQEEHQRSASKALEAEGANERAVSESNSRQQANPGAHRPPFFPPQPMAAVLFADNYHHVDPYLRFLPFYMGPRPIYPHKLPLARMHGVAPVVPGSPMEQQIIGQNQLSYEGASGEAASEPCIPPCPAMRKSSKSDSRRKRGIANDSSFPPSFNSWISGLARKSGNLRERQMVLVETGSDADENNGEVDPVAQSKLLLTGEPETIRNPQFMMSSGSEELLKKDEEHDEYPSKNPIGFKGNEKYKSYKKLFLTSPQKKVSKKKLAGMETSPSDVNSDLQETPAPHPWRIPAFGENPFTGRMAPSLLGEGETPMVDEGTFFRGKRSMSHVRFLHPYIDPEGEVEDDLMAEDSNDMYLSAVAGSKRKSHRGKIIPLKSNTNKEKYVEEQVKIKNRDHIPWLDPTMMEDHEGHLHRNYPNDFKFSGYDH